MSTVSIQLVSLVVREGKKFKLPVVAINPEGPIAVSIQLVSLVVREKTLTVVRDQLYLGYAMFPFN